VVEDVQVVEVIEGGYDVPSIASTT